MINKYLDSLKSVLGRNIERVTVPPYLNVTRTGMYLVSYSLTAWNGISSSDFATILFLRRNAEKIPGSGFDADVDLAGIKGGMGVSSGRGGMSTFLKLESGDKIDLYCQHCPKIGNINLCINFEYEI